MRPTLAKLLYGWIKTRILKYLDKHYSVLCELQQKCILLFVQAAISLRRFLYYLNESFLIWFRNYQSIKHRSNFHVAYLCLVIRAINNPATKQFSLRRVRLTVNDIHKNSFPFEKKFL